MENIILPQQTVMRLMRIDEQIRILELAKRSTIETIIEGADTDHKSWRITEDYQLEAAVGVEEIKKYYAPVFNNGEQNHEV